MSEIIREEWERQQQEIKRIQRANAERIANPWAIYLNGKLYARTDSHAQVRRISAALQKQHPAAAITQKYEGKSIDHQPNKGVQK